MDRGQMREAMILMFIEEINPYIEKGWLELTDQEELNTFAAKWVFGKTSPSFDYKGIWLSVDFEMGAGCMVGAPTSTRYTTVFCENHSERFTRKELINKAYQYFCRTEEQLTLF